MINLSTQSFFARSNEQLKDLRSQAELAQNQIATGERLAKSSDDPIAAARLRMLGRQERLNEANERNGEQVMVDLRLADEAIGSIANVAIRARDLAMAAANATSSDVARANIAVEVQALRDGLFSLLNAKDSSDHALFGGLSTGAAYVDDGATVTYAGTASSPMVELAPGDFMPKGVVGPDIVNFSHDGMTKDFFSVLDTLITALNGPSANAVAAAQEASDALTVGIERITHSQTMVGSRMVLIGLADEQRQAEFDALANEQSRLGGVDLASTVAGLQNLLTVLEASQASFVKLSNLSLFDRLR